MKRLLRMILSRTSLVLLLVLAQLVLLFYILNFLSQFLYIQIINYTLSVLIVLYLMVKEENPVYKMSWIMPILIFPLFGGIFYIIYRQQNFSPRIIQRFKQIDYERFDYVNHLPELIPHKPVRYLRQLNWPVYQHTKLTFLSSGEAMYQAMLEDLSRAKSYIFLEFFIINRGIMWDTILTILEKKAKDGVDIKLIYDDFGSSSLPYRYHKKLKKMGIDAIPFNPMRLHLNFAMNYRDHRKIVIIDGKVGYTGGINIGDEYINLISPFGHWLDTGIRLEGEAVYSLTISFLENYRFQTNRPIDYKLYATSYHVPSDGYVAPFNDAPLDKELVSKNMYLSLINEAKHKIDITTPYLIIDNELSEALKLSAKSGVQIRIIIPYIPDKKLIFMVTESYVPELMQAGVFVYRYTPGFIHSKMMVVDDSEALIGTCNLDFRSLYLHFENMVYLKDSQVIRSMEEFFDETIKKSKLIDQTKKRNPLYRLIQVILRGFSSLM
ncbi:MAG: cardiolipin synthase [Acholeplasmataceae bacterium]|nr:cardiolipin synthase [Acholeplasmataceae bacterium]